MNTPDTNTKCVHCTTEARGIIDPQLADWLYLQIPFINTFHQLTGKVTVQRIIHSDTFCLFAQLRGHCLTPQREQRKRGKKLVNFCFYYWLKILTNCISDSCHMR